ncbi:MAG: glycosyltransferase family 39 protein [Patescibacteria group bacterium]|jgi:4-amino-4-deoxy-L-arabinose transferase-like glycosyltransferase
MFRKKEFLTIIGLFIFSIIVRLVISAFYPVGSDSVLYLKLAERISQGFLSLNEFKKVHEFIQPGYSFFIYLFNLVINNWEIAALAVSIISGVFLVLLTYLLAKRLFNSTTAVIAGILMCLHPMALYFSTSVLTESLFTALLISVIYLSWLALVRKKSVFFFILIGFLIGLAYYVRIVGLAALPVVVLWILLFGFLIEKRKLKYLLFSIMLLCLGVLAVVSPYLIYLYQQKGEFVITGAQNTAEYVKSEFGADKMETRLQKHQIFSSLDETGSDFKINEVNETAKKSTGDLLSIYWKNFWGCITDNIIKFLGYFFIFSFTCIYILIRKRSRQATISFFYLLSWIPFYLIIYYQGRPDLRYYFPVLPLMIIIIASLFSSIFSHKFNKLTRIFGLASLILFFLIIEMFINRKFPLVPLSIFKESNFHKAGIVIKENFGANQKILSEYPAVTYYSEGIHYPLPVDDYSSVTQFARYQNVDLLLLIKQEHSTRPNMDLLYNVTENDDWKLVISAGSLYLFQLKK